MQLEGFSHISLRANSPIKFEETLHFYNAFAFKKCLDQLRSNGKEQTNGDDEENHIRNVWLKLDTARGNLTNKLIIKLSLSASAVDCDQKPNEDVDWGLEEQVIVLITKDIDKVRSQLQELGASVQDVPESDSEKLYALDPLGNVLLFTNKLAFPGLLNEQSHEGVPASIEGAAQPAEQPRKIAVLTSGGDAPGMNPCVRAVVRYGISKGCEMYAVYEGYQGLVDGGSQIRRMDWKSVRGWIRVGGTSIGTARCKPFQTSEGRLQGAENLIKRGIDSIIVCGGDGSLTGADVFRSEWPGLVDTLKDANRISAEQAEKHKHLTIVGLVGSIDNDMSSTDITIGAVTSLHRICEAVDSINTTALSHSRAFVVEVMGRHCGWLALMAGIATGADFVFIPERPPSEDDWESRLCNVTQRHRDLGKRKTVVIVAEGALDSSLKPIKADHIKSILCDRLGVDTRVTTLGHVQRGGSPCAADRVLATIQGVEAVRAVLTAKIDTPSPLIISRNNRVATCPLMQAVELTHEVAKAIQEKNFARAMELRDPQFAEEFDAFTASTILDDCNANIVLPDHRRLRIAIVHIGAPSGGMNAATRTAVRYALNRGHHPIAVYNGFSGLVRGTMQDATWIGVDGWTSHGGSELGTNRHVPGIDVDMGMVAYQMQKNKIQGLMVVGGFEAFSSLVELEKGRKYYPSLCVPICHLPATISNNVPGTDYSLGTDTSLNAIVSSCDAIGQSARSSRRRVFVVEVQGGKSGYLAVEAGLASGANTIYIPEEGITLSRLQSDVKHLLAMYMDDDADMSEGRIILRTEDVSETYTTDVISNILKDEGHQLFDSRTAVLGHIQQGDTPSPLDRIRATRLAMRCVQFIEDHSSNALDKAHGEKQPVPVELTDCDESVAVVGISGANVKNNSIKELLPITDLKKRKPRAAWWFEHRPLVDLLSGRGMFTPQAQKLLAEEHNSDNSSNENSSNNNQ
ncbi:6-phosphofructokinase [Zychaea mexicana]|uniref:6-phosphofructokinase n=1 Tax=Zychaea mexicana TaxID=64656 RepID=UPI0022FDBA7F|nr:6-phosphofructokinase [Zychaea mexicana]KAI9497468.1 6-phosphofructokinase [Zychaea mexicana]